MRCPEGLDTRGKQRTGTDQQPAGFLGFRDKEAIGFDTFCVKEDESHKFNEVLCESREDSELNTFCRDENKGYKFKEFLCDIRNIQS
jgi:hypothetical protein